MWHQPARFELTSILSNLNNFHSLEVVDRVTQGVMPRVWYDVMLDDTVLSPILSITTYWSADMTFFAFAYQDV